jgi:hypothetical protein
MSNIFKSNSRFAALVDDIPQQKNEPKKDKEKKKELEANVKNKEENFNSFKSERPFYESRQDYYRLERESEIKAKKDEEREKERLKQVSLNIENFPDLVMSEPKNESIENFKSYIETLKKEEIDEKHIDPDLENLKPGCVLLKRDPLTGRTITKQHPETIEKKAVEKSENEIAIDVFNALVKLHQKRTEEYIENYGYDEWERMFKFPDWRERELYLEAMEEMENESDESEYEPECEDEEF